VLSSLKMDLFTQVKQKKASSTAEEEWITQMVTFTKEIGLMVKQQELAFSATLMEAIMMGSGKMTNNMAKELKSGTTAK